MRVRPKRQAEPRRTLIPRRGWNETVHQHSAAAAAPPPLPAGPAAPQATPERREESRMRASGGPEDRALYRCQCGFAFQASVSTTVACPHCGTGQAW